MKFTVNSVFTFLFLILFTSGTAFAADALRKMTVGQAGVNPGAGLFSICVNQGLYKKHGLDVEIIKTNTTAAVQAMVSGKMQMATGAGAAAFVTATLEGSPQPFVLVGSWVNVFPYKIIDRKSTRLNSSHLGISYAV